MKCLSFLDDRKVGHTPMYRKRSKFTPEPSDDYDRGFLCERQKPHGKRENVGVVGTK